MYTTQFATVGSTASFWATSQSGEAGRAVYLLRRLPQQKQALKSINLGSVLKFNKSI